MLYPFKFKKVFKEKIWGGRELDNILDMKLPDDINIGESWEISAHPNGMSIISNGELKGKTLKDIYDKYPIELVGKNVYDRFPDRFPLLIKYLNVNDRLSIQVHPDDVYARKYHNDLGKSECWYIMYASDDAKLILGMKDGIDKNIYLDKVKRNEYDMFNIVPVKTGDFINIEPGTVHASLEGSLLFAEIQENSDITYRIYDFDRLEKGVKRPLHVKESSETIAFDRKIEILSTEEMNNIRLIKGEYYTIDKVNIRGEYIDYSDTSFIIYSFLKGEATLYWNNDKINIKMGETMLIPINTKICIKGDIDIIRTIL